MQYVPVRGWRTGTPPKPPKAAMPEGGFVLEVEMVRGIRWMRERLLTGGEAARQESRWVWDRGSSGLRAGIKKCCGLNRTTDLSIFFFT